MFEMAESPRALGVQEEKDLKKFLKFLSLKVAAEVGTHQNLTCPLP